MVPRVGQCLSTAAAERWTAEGNTISPFNREPIFGFDVALNQIDLLKEVAQAYQAPRKPAEARELALEAYAAHLAAQAAPAGAAPPTYQELLARPRAASGVGAGADAGSPQPP